MTAEPTLQERKNALKKASIDTEISEVQEELIEDIYNPGDNGKCPPRIAFNVGKLFGLLAKRAVVDNDTRT